MGCSMEVVRTREGQDYHNDSIVSEAEIEEQAVAAVVVVAVAAAEIAAAVVAAVAVAAGVVLATRSMDWPQGEARYHEGPTHCRETIYSSLGS